MHSLKIQASLSIFWSSFYIIWIERPYVKETDEILWKQV